MLSKKKISNLWQSYKECGDTVKSKQHHMSERLTVTGQCHNEAVCVFQEPPSEQSELVERQHSTR